jgi:hypothetical protein
MSKAAEKTSSSSEPILGTPLPEFQATVDTLQQLCQDAKFQIFLARGNLIRFIGDPDEFRMALGSRLKIEPVDKNKADKYLEEVQMFLQVLVAMRSSGASVRVFRNHVYDNEFREAKKNPDRAKALQEIIKQKIDAVVSKLSSNALLERAKRLATVIGPSLEEVDIEIVSERKSPAKKADIEGPFLRLRFLYLEESESVYPFMPPPWLTDPPRNARAFDLECDETDIDLVLKRLIQAKNLLNRAIDLKVSEDAKK